MASASVQRMTALAEQIQEKTKIIADFLTSKGLDAASFDVNGLAEFPISAENRVPHKARQDLIGLTQELHNISVGPKESLRYLAWDVRHFYLASFASQSTIAITNCFACSASTTFRCKQCGNSRSPKQFLSTA